MPGKKETQEEQSEYIGNIWGWKFSLISLGIILFFVLLMTYRHLTVPEPEKAPVEQVEVSPDTLDSPSGN